MHFFEQQSAKHCLDWCTITISEDKYEWSKHGVLMMMMMLMMMSELLPGRHVGCCCCWQS